MKCVVIESVVSEKKESPHITKVINEIYINRSAFIARSINTTTCNHSEICVFKDKLKQKENSESVF